MLLSSGIIITQQIEDTLSQLLRESTVEKLTIIKNEDSKGNLKEFLVEHAKEAIEKAYISSEKLNYIILVAPRFSQISQNILLKLLEEPPKNKELILITQSKSALLDTIQSRMPIRVLDDKRDIKPLSLDLENLSLKNVYDFIQENKRTSNVECKILVEHILLESIKTKAFKMDKSLLEMFSNSIKALDVGSPTSFILIGLLLKLLAKKKR